MLREFRSIKARELRAEKGEDGKQYLTGYAATFNTLSSDLGWFRERIMPGAFGRALREQQDVRHLKNHDPNLVLGRTKSGTLELSEDTKGLQFRTLMPDTTYANDLMASVARGDIDECSFGFSAIRTVWIDEPDPDDPTGKAMRCIRELHDLDLFDISTVTYPAYPNTSAAMERSLFPDGMPAEVRSHMPSARGKAKTKRVDGEDLTADAFLIVGDKNDTSTWKLPVKFSTEAKTASHLRNALARFGQLKGVSQEEKDVAWKKLVSLCKKHDIEVSDEEQKSWKNFTRRDFDYDGDGDNDQPLVDALENVSQDASDFARCAAAALSEVSNSDAKDGPKALAEALAEAKELSGLLDEFISEATKEAEEESSEQNSRKRHGKRAASTCECDCASCKDGNCEECSMEDCEDEACREKGCPMQDDDRSRRARVALALAEC